MSKDISPSHSKTILNQQHKHATLKIHEINALQMNWLEFGGVSLMEMHRLTSGSASTVDVGLVVTRERFGTRVNYGEELLAG